MGMTILFVLSMLVLFDPTGLKTERHMNRFCDNVWDYLRFIFPGRG